jgi:hypothetical protein
MAASSDGSTVSIRCEFSHLGSCCGKFNNYTNNKVDQIDNCTKDTTTHLNRLHSIDVSSANFPEGLLILYRSGIFSVDRAAKILSICPWHRDFLEFIGVTILLSINSKEIQLAAREKLIEELHQPCRRNTGF